MSFIGDLFGGKEKTTTVETASRVPISYTSPVGFSAIPYGRRGLSASNTSLKIGPDNVSNAAYARFNNGLALGKSRTNNLMGRLGSNMNPFIEARVRPLEEQFANTRGQLERGLNQRGVFGSLANNEMLKFDTEANRQMADQRALATNEALNAMMANEQLFQGLNQDELNLVGTRLKEDLGTLGLSLEALRLIRGDIRQTSQVAGGTNTQTSRGGFDLGSVLGGVGTIMGAF